MKWWRGWQGTREGLVEQGVIEAPGTDESSADAPRNAAADMADTVGVAGERGIPSVNRVRSLQSRVSSALAIALVSVIGIGLLTWYYSQTLTRGERAQRAAERATQQRAQGEMALPPLGPIERPRMVAADVPADGATSSREPSMTDRMLGPPPAPPPAASGPVAVRASRAAGYGQAPKSAEAQALERRLAGTVFITASSRSSSANAAGARATDRTLPTGLRGSADEPAAAASARGLEAMLTPSVMSATEARVLSSQRLLLPKGTFVDCTLETAIDTSLAGLTTCITATDTFSADGDVVLLERGTKLIGETRGQVQPGAARVFVLWSEARTPGGVIAPLESPGTDELGRSGLPGHVNRHFWERFGAAILISVIDGAVQAAAQSQSDGTVIVNPSTSSQIMTEVLRNTINIPPTVLKHQGDRIQVLVARDIDFRSVYALRVTE
jgi:type IV secretion system protein VirB10